MKYTLKITLFSILLLSTPSYAEAEENHPGPMAAGMAAGCIAGVVAGGVIAKNVKANPIPPMLGLCIVGGVATGTAAAAITDYVSSENDLKIEDQNNSDQ
ncbi:MAG: hypothetical protein ACXWQO_02185 [Bdellovibrionota bacterium]